MGENELTPLDVLLQTMSGHWDNNQTAHAVAMAKAAVPYLHAKPTGGKPAGGLICALGDDELDELLRTAGEGETGSTRDQEEP